MNNILRAWNAGFVRRWHTHVRMVDFDDRDNAHQHRCTVLLLLFFPNSSRASIIDTIIHDQGEVAAGDMAHPTKKRFPEIAIKLQKVEDDEIEAQGFPRLDINDVELFQRRFVDLLDSYVWMLRNCPSLRKRPEWITRYETLETWAMSLDVYTVFNDFMESCSAFYID